jgi:hypothetical protein
LDCRLGSQKRRPFAAPSTYKTKTPFISYTYLFGMAIAIFIYKALAGLSHGEMSRELKVPWPSVLIQQ